MCGSRYELRLRLTCQSTPGAWRCRHAVPGVTALCAGCVCGGLCGDGGLGGGVMVVEVEVVAMVVTLTMAMG